MVALLSMGVATTTIGLLPTFSTIGVLAPILLVSLRFIQGVAVGGQQGGALLLVAESAPSKRRGFFSSFAQAGAPAGIILANLAFLLVTSVTSSASFESWGWRIPFLASIVLVALAAYIQVRLEDTPAFRRLQENRTVQHQAVDHAQQTPKPRGSHPRSPVVEALRKYPKQIALAAGAYTAVNMTYYVFTTFVISFGTSPAFLGMSKNLFLAAVLIASLVQLAALPLAGALTDRVGRRSVYLTGALLLGIFSFFFWPLLDTRSPALIIVALVVGLGVLHSMMYGPQGALFAETFSTSVRYSGVSLGVQLGSLLGGAFAPLVATALLAEIGSTIAIATYMAAMCSVTFISVLFLRETHRSALDRNPAAVEAPGTSK